MKRKTKAILKEPLKQDEIVNIAHKIRLEPNNVQKTYLNKAIGCARLAYNWGLSEWKRAYENGEKPNALRIRKSFNAIRKEKYPFTYEVSKSVTNQAILDLGKAYLNFFKGLSNYPQYKKKSYTEGSFYLDGENIKFKNINEITKKEIKAQYVLIPKLGFVKMSERLRFNGKINSCCISRQADKYFISFSLEITQEEFEKTHKYVSEKPKNLLAGVDIGSISAIALDNGYKVKPPKPLSKANKKYAKLSKKLSKKQHRRSKDDQTKASNNYIKASRKLGRLAAHIANIRNDFNHKETSKVVAKNKFIAMETLNVKGMIKNRKLSKSISDVSYASISNKIEYKAKYCGRYVYRADMFFASSKTCLACNEKHPDLKLSDRIFICPFCGFTIDRDVASAKNLKQNMEEYLIAIAHREFTLAKISSVDERNESCLRSALSLKQEDSVKSIRNLD